MYISATIMNLTQWDRSRHLGGWQLECMEKIQLFKKLKISLLTHLLFVLMLWHTKFEGYVGVILCFIDLFEKVCKWNYFESFDRKSNEKWGMYSEYQVWMSFVCQRTRVVCVLVWCKHVLCVHVLVCVCLCALTCRYVFVGGSARKHVQMCEYRFIQW